MLINIIKEKAIEAINELYGITFSEKDFQVNTTKPEFEGDYTIVLFSLIKSLRMSPDELGNQLGEKLVADHADLFGNYNIQSAIEWFASQTFKCFSSHGNRHSPSCIFKKLQIIWQMPE
jgi:arginyl-tRNA synthetase